MKIRLLHTADALEPPVDPVLDQLEQALARARTRCRRTAVAGDASRRRRSFVAGSRTSCSTSPNRSDGKSALESNVAALLNLLDMPYTGSSPGGPVARRRQEAHEEGAPLSRDSDAGVRDVVSRRARLGGRSNVPGDRQTAAGGCVARHHVARRSCETQGPVRAHRRVCRRSFSSRCSSSSSSRGASSTSACWGTERRGVAGDRARLQRVSGRSPQDRQLGGEVGRGRQGGDAGTAPSSRARIRSSRPVWPPS